jgi:hypothetical protein
LVGIGIALGSMITFGFARAMSQRTPNGGLVDAMLKAYRRTLEKTMEQARSMNEVVANDEVAALAETPDKAVVWGIALGLYAQVSAVLARSLEDLQSGGATSTAPVYYPAWFGSSPASGLGSAETGILRGGGGLFSGSALPDVGGMFNALGSLGSSPPSSASSSGGGGFGGGGSSGGGGASGSF